MALPEPVGAWKRATQRLWRRLHPRAAGGQVLGLTAGQLIAGLLSAAWLLVAAHRLHRNAFGDLSLMLALAGIFLIFSDLGLTTALGLHVARQQVLDPRLVGHVVRRRLWLSVAAAVAAGAFYLIASPHGSEWVPVIFVGYFVGASIYTTETVALRSLDRTYVESLNLVLSRMGVLGIGYIWLSHGGGLLAASTVYSGAAIASAVVISMVTRRYMRQDTTPLPTDELRVRRTFVFAMAVVTATFYASVDIWLLATIKNTSVSGGYAAADRILDAALLPAAAIAVLTQSRYPRYERGSGRRFVARLAAAATASTAIPLLIGSLFAGWLMATLFGPSFRSDSTVLIVLLCSAPAGAAIGILSLPIALRSKGLFLGLLSAGLAVNVSLNVALIPVWGAVGSAAANLIGDVFVLSLMAWTFFRRPAVSQA